MRESDALWLVSWGVLLDETARLPAMPAGQPPIFQRARPRQRRQLHQQRRVHRPTRRWTSPSPHEISTCTWRYANRRYSDHRKMVKWRPLSIRLFPVGPTRSAVSWSTRTASITTTSRNGSRTGTGRRRPRMGARAALVAISVHNAAKPEGWQPELFDKGKEVHGHKLGSASFWRRGPRGTGSRDRADGRPRNVRYRCAGRRARHVCKSQVGSTIGERTG